MTRILLLSILLISARLAHGQILISLVLGDKLNSGKMEFGLDGGANFSTLPGVSGSTSTTRFHLGFYFDIKTKTNWLLHTGVIVKSPMGAEGITPYSLNNVDLDNAFASGSVARNLRYFNVPVMMKYRFKNHFYAEGGVMLGLMHKAFDKFENEINDPEDLTYTLNIKDHFHPLDAGPVVGIGYRLMGGNGMNLGVRYYYGLVDITIDDSGADVYNRSLYLAVGIPIGAGKAKEQRVE